MGVVQRSQGAMVPASEHLLSEPRIVARLARAVLGEKSRVDWEGLTDDYDRIRDAIERVIPGFADYNQRARKPGGFYLPNGAREGNFTTSSGRARFTVHQSPRVSLEPGQLLMTSIRSHDQYNTTIYGLKDRYRGVRNDRRVIFMNRDDIAALGFQDGSAVDLLSHFQGQVRVASGFTIVDYDIPRGCTATYYPETNVLVPLDSTADGSNTPTSKSITITLRPARDAA